MSTICDDLRAAILQAAMQGRLTKQLPEDGGASELLKEAVKARGASVKKNKESQTITDEEKPFTIPDSWLWARVGDVFSHNTGKTKNAAQNTSGESRKYITTSNLYWNYFDFSKVGKMNFKKEELERYTVRKGDLLVCEGGDFGRTAIWNYDEEVCFQNHVHRLRFFYQMNAEFFYWLFYFYKHSGLIKGKGIGIQGLSSGVLHNIVFPIPPLAEQKRIVEKIDELMACVADLEQSANALASLKKAFPDDIKASLLQAAMRGKLTKQLPEDGNAEDLLEQIKAEKEKLIAEGKIKKQKPLAPITDDEIPFSIPNNWKWAYISEVCYFQEGPGILAKDFRKNGIPLIRIAGMQGNIVSLEGCNYLDPEMVKEKWSHFKLDEGDIVISTSASLDKIAEVDVTSVGAIPYTGLIRFKMFDGISKDFFKYFIKSPFYTSQIKEQEAGATIKHYGPTHLNHMLMPIPPLAEQKRIVERLNDLMQNINVVGDLIANE